ncbi:MAG: RdgB/HAM1 family non-canonical purine NTP pyrophosphatase [Muribaculaceae bacterium]|nr:RdgB/HAM1 family non-canonical purine NTP pyrophosphatase [Muribaculaceae bacterium]
MQEKLVFATNNAHKIAEVRAILGDRRQILSLEEIGCHEEIPETAGSIEGNALQKARWVSQRFDCDCFADDTGLEVEALGGEPGVMSARYAQANGRGDGHDSTANSALLLEKMEGIENRKARFRTAIALIIAGKETVVEGIVNGSIATAPHGTDGFGYDPLFIPEGESKTFAEMSPTEKNAISHRRRATEALLKVLKDNL